MSEKEFSTCARNFDLRPLLYSTYLVPVQQQIGKTNIGNWWKFARVTKSPNTGLENTQQTLCCELRLSTAKSVGSWAKSPRQKEARALSTWFRTTRQEKPCSGMHTELLTRGHTLLSDTTPLVIFQTQAQITS